MAKENTSHNYIVGEVIKPRLSKSKNFRRAQKKALL